MIEKVIVHSVYSKDGTPLNDAEFKDLHEALEYSKTVYDQHGEESLYDAIFYGFVDMDDYIKFE